MNIFGMFYAYSSGDQRFSERKLRDDSMKKMQIAIFFLFVIFLFAPDNPVSAVLPANELWREDLVNNVVGFGKNTTGGKGGTLCQVTNLNDSGAGSLRACAESVGPKWIIFTVSGTIRLFTFLQLYYSNKTIDGRGADITIENQGFIIGWIGSPNPSPVSNVIIHNLKFKNEVGGRMIGVGAYASNVWIDHNTFQNAIDEIIFVGCNSTDVAWAPHGITISWNHFPAATPGQGWADKSLLISGDPSYVGDAGITVSLHHNRYQTYVRHPLARHAKIHAFNNYYDGTIIGAQPRTNTQFYSENEIFRFPSSGGVNPMVWPDAYPASGDTAGNARVINPWLINGATVRERNPGDIFNPSAFYGYVPDVPNAALQTAIVNGAGWKNVTTPTTQPQAPSNLAVAP
jgi:pectate lyase